ncbi:Hypothetical protein (Fragment) [Durusdinium trenchii]|uniref:U-box domain-containing protein n=1 Tax=Durusdinium trenchii TaxID=1381693 RepID=A0ABP0L0Y4_9DINO
MLAEHGMLDDVMAWVEEEDGFEGRFNEDVGLQKATLVLVNRVYGDRFSLADLCMLFEENAGKALQVAPRLPASRGGWYDDDEETDWEQVHRVIRGVVSLLYGAGLLDPDSDLEFLEVCNRLLMQVLSPATFFQGHGENQVSPHMLSQVCLRMELVAQELMRFDSPGERLWEMLSLDKNNMEVRVQSALEVFRGVMELLPGDGWEFRCWVGMGDFVEKLCIPFLLRCWTHIVLSETKDRENIDYHSGALFLFDGSNKRWTRPSTFRSDWGCKGFETCCKLLISLSANDVVRRHFLRLLDPTNRFFEELDQELGGKLPEGAMHRELAWILLMNVTCFSEDPEIGFANRDLIEGWLSNASAEECWCHCIDADSGEPFFIKLLEEGDKETEDSLHTQWERPCVTACAWEEFRDATHVQYRHFSGHVQQDLPKAFQEVDAQQFDERVERKEGDESKFDSCKEEKSAKTNVLEALARSVFMLPPMAPSRIVQRFGRKPSEELKGRRAPKRRAQLSGVGNDKGYEDAAPGNVFRADDKQLHFGERFVPISFRCALSGELMRNPVVAPDDKTYERETLVRHLLEGPVAKTHVRLSTADLDRLKPNGTLEKEIVMWHIRQQMRSQLDTEDIYEF